MLFSTMFSLLKFLDRVKLKVYTVSLRLISVKFSLRTSYYEIVQPWKVVFYGSDQRSEVTLRALHSNVISSTCDKIVNKVDVICIKSACPVRRYATLNNLTIYTWPYNVPSNVYDVGVTVSFGYMIPNESILACKYGIINAHPSLLPRWRGAAALQYAILNGDVETGVTITQVSPNKFDAGNILMQEKYQVPIGCSAQSLASDLSKMSADLIMKTLKNLPHYIESGYPQPEEGITHAPKIKPHHGNINWEQDSRLLIYRKYKAFHGFVDLYTFYKDKKVAILELATMDLVEKANVSSLVSVPVHPGFIYFHKKRKILFVKCQDGWCGILSVKVPIKGKLSAHEFYYQFLTEKERNKCYFHAK